MLLVGHCQTVHPEVVGSGGHPACRRGRASCRPEQRLKRGGCVLVRTRDPPGKMPRLYGRQDARRYDCADNFGMRRLRKGSRHCNRRSRALVLRYALSEQLVGIEIMIALRERL